MLCSIVEFVSKTSEYALLVGLLKAKAAAPGSMADKAFAQSIIDAAVKHALEALSSGNAVEAKLMLRFLAECVDAGALSATEVLAFCQACMAASHSCGRAAVAVLAAHAVGMMLVWCGQMLKPTSADFQALVAGVRDTAAQATSVSMPGISNTLSPLTPSLAQWSEQDTSGEVPGGSSPLGAGRLALVEMLHALESLEAAAWSGDAVTPVDRLTPRLQDALHPVGAAPPHPLSLPSTAPLPGHTWGAPPGSCAHGALVPAAAGLLGDAASLSSGITAAAIAGAFAGLPTARFFGANPDTCLSTGASITKALGLQRAAQHPTWLLLARDWAADTLFSHHPFHADAAAAIMTMACAFPLSPVAAEVALECTLLAAPRPRFQSPFYTAFLIDLIYADSEMLQQGGVGGGSDGAPAATAPSLQAVGMCMRVVYKRIAEGKLGDDTGEAVAEWLAHYISCMEFAWFWEEWADAVTPLAPKADWPLPRLPLDYSSSARRFVRAALDKAFALTGSWHREELISTVVPKSVRHAVPGPPLAWSDHVNPVVLREEGALALLKGGGISSLEGALAADGTGVRDLTDLVAHIFLRLRAKTDDLGMAGFLKSVLVSAGAPPSEGVDGGDAVQGEEAVESVSTTVVPPTKLQQLVDAVTRESLPAPGPERVRLVAKVFMQCISVHGRATLRHAETLLGRYRGTLRCLVRRADPVVAQAAEEGGPTTLRRLPPDTAQGDADLILHALPAGGGAWGSLTEAPLTGVGALLEGLVETWCTEGKGLKGLNELARESGATHQVQEVLTIMLNLDIVPAARAVQWLLQQGASSSVRPLLPLEAEEGGIDAVDTPPAAVHTLKAVLPYDTWSATLGVLDDVLAADAEATAAVRVTCDILKACHSELQNASAAVMVGEAEGEMDTPSVAADTPVYGDAATAGMQVFRDFILQDATAQENVEHFEEKLQEQVRDAVAARYASVAAVRVALARLAALMTQAADAAAAAGVSGGGADAVVAGEPAGSEEEVDAAAALGSAAVTHWRQLLRHASGAVWRELAAGEGGGAADVLKRAGAAFAAAHPEHEAVPDDDAFQATQLDDAALQESAASAEMQTVARVPDAANFAQKALGWWSLLSASVSLGTKTAIAEAEAQARADTVFQQEHEGMLRCMARDAAFVWSAVLGAQSGALTHAALLKDAGHSLQVPE